MTNDKIQMTKKWARRSQDIGKLLCGSNVSGAKVKAAFRAALQKTPGRSGGEIVGEGRKRGMGGMGLMRQIGPMARMEL